MKKRSHKPLLGETDQLSRFEPASYLRTPEDIHHFADACLDDPTTFQVQQDCAGTMAKALGIQMLVRATGIPYADLTEALHATTYSPAYESTIAKVISTYRDLPTGLTTRSS